MADKQIPLFPKATSMFVHSGNIINWNRLKRKPNLSPTDEVNYDGLRLKSKYLKFEGATTSLEMGAIWRKLFKNFKNPFKKPRFYPRQINLLVRFSVKEFGVFFTSKCLEMSQVSWENFDMWEVFDGNG